MGHFFKIGQILKYFRESKVVVAETTGGVSPLGWITISPITLIDEALSDYDTVWAAAGHPHSVFRTTFNELIVLTGALPIIVSG